MPLYLTEDELAGLLTPADALEAVEGSFRRLACGETENVPRQRTRFEGGFLAVMWAVDRELGLAGLKSYAAGGEGASFVVLLFDAETTKPVAVIEADKLGQLRTGAASGVAARHLAREGATSLGVIGCGWQARSQVASIRGALPRIERVVAYCRTEESLREFCRETGAEAGESHSDRSHDDGDLTALPQTAQPFDELLPQHARSQRARLVLHMRLRGGKPVVLGEGHETISDLADTAPMRVLRSAPFPLRLTPTTFIDAVVRDFEPIDARPLTPGIDGVITFEGPSS